MIKMIADRSFCHAVFGNVEAGKSYGEGQITEAVADYHETIGLGHRAITTKTAAPVATPPAREDVSKVIDSLKAPIVKKARK